MTTSKLFLFFFFISLAYSSSSSFSNYTHRCSIEQSRDLFMFKQNHFSANNDVDDSFHYECHNWLGSSYYPIMMNWNTSIDCCNWDGVTCSHVNGDVIGLDLSCGMLRGTIHPNTTLFNLPRLERLNLAFNDFFSSQLPREIGRFSNSLTHLNISGCLFVGQVPTDITLLRKLVSLDLSRNDFNVRLQPHVLINLLQNYTLLKDLSIAWVNISIVLPTYLNVSSSIKSLDLRYTGLKGELPQNIFALQYMETLKLSGYELTGRFPKINMSANIPLKFLSLTNTGLSGEIPNSIGHLKSLNYLDLSRNHDLSGEIPSSIGHLKSLNYLDLSFNTGLSGDILYSIGHLKSLDTLRISSCSFMGPLPKSIVNLRHLTTLSLLDNKLNGTLPSWLFTLPSLENIDLRYNMFHGSLPLEMFNHQSLKGLLLGGNQLVGKIDVLDQGPIIQTFRQLTTLTELDLSYNNFKGDWELDSLLSSLTNLTLLDLSYSGLSVLTSNLSRYINPDFQYLNLGSCKLTVFPESLRAMKNLQALDLSSNEIQGHIPDWAGEIGGNELVYLNLSHNFIEGLPQLRWHGLGGLYLQSNKIQGPFPPSICNMSNLEYLTMSDNSFDGGIPHCFGSMSSSLSMVDLGNNHFNGTIPNAFENCGELRGLILNQNQFEGEVPSSLSKCQYLEVINLGNNHFHGTIPNAFENCGGLQGLILNQNQFEGEVPSSLSKCQYLEVINLGNNHFNGTFPGWLGDLPGLKVLDLKSNNFHGPIETFSKQKVPFSRLLVLDLSHNGFVGHLPHKYFQSFSAMKDVEKNREKPSYLNLTEGYYYSISVEVKGVEQVFPQIFVHYTIVDLSNNRFEGEIPDIIGSLNSLIVLDLSHNNLTGPIPHALGNLSEIESLDLSCNQLAGKIPQSLADLSFLEFLNLSQNHLVGRIPTGKQFNTFGENAFGGNPRLCGLPLPDKCEHPHEPPAEDDGDTEDGFTWRVVMLGYGCGTLVGLLMGYIMLSTGRPKWFNAIADVAENMINTRKNKRR